MKKINKTNSKNILDYIEQQCTKENKYKTLGSYALKDKQIDLVIDTQPSFNTCLNIVSEVINWLISPDGTPLFIFKDFMLFTAYLENLTNLNTENLTLEKSWTLYEYTDLKEKVFATLEENFLHNEILELLDSKWNYELKKNLVDTQSKCDELLQEAEEYVRVIKNINENVKGADINKFNKLIEAFLDGNISADSLQVKSDQDGGKTKQN